MINPTRRQIFDKVKAHMLKQGEPSIDLAQTRCMFRNQYGQSCAVGCLIPSPLYKRSMELLPARELAKLHPELAQHGISRNNIDLLERLMHIHDKLDPKKWAQAFDDFERNSPDLLND